MAARVAQALVEPADFRNTLSAVANRSAEVVTPATSIRGRTTAIVFGAYLLWGTDPGEMHLKNGYMHMKLTSILALLGVHGFVRVRVGKARKGNPRTIPVWVTGLAYGLILAPILLITLGPG